MASGSCGSGGTVIAIIFVPIGYSVCPLSKFPCTGY